MVAVKTYLALIALALAAHLHLIGAVNYNICDESKLLAEIKDVKINDCDSTIDPCSFVRGFNKSIELDFIPKQNLDNVKVKVAGKLGTLPIPFAVTPDIACGNYGFNCPLEAGKLYKFNLSLPIKRSYPAVNVKVIFRLVNDKGESISCIEIPAIIHEPRKDM